MPSTITHNDFILRIIAKYALNIRPKDTAVIQRLETHLEVIGKLFYELYSTHPHKDEQFELLIVQVIQQGQNRAMDLQARDKEKATKDHWFLSNEIVGMSLYVDRFAGKLQDMPSKLPYLEDLGVNFLHLMPLFESPEGESDGGYAVSNFRKVDTKFGNLQDLEKLRKLMHEKGMYLMLDIVLNHTSHKHEWAEKAKAGDPYYQSFFYMYDNRWIPNQYEQSMPEIFPEGAPGNFTWVPECNRWVMTVFHNYQWDLNYMNPIVLKEMVDNVLFYANLGVDVLRVDAPAFIWKQTGTTSQNLPQVHSLLQLIKHCVLVAAPGMALLGEAIVAPQEIIKYFGTGPYTAKECDFAYNATHMALQWDTLATGDTELLMSAQHLMLQKPYGTSWITYTRCHDDIGLGYTDEMIRSIGKNPYHHRKFITDFYSGNYPNSPSKGALFSFNPKTGDARISGTLASLCGLELALETNNTSKIEESIQKILLMQAHSLVLGGLPMLFYGDEIGYTNDYSFYDDPAKSYDNRWMHRPLIDWEKAANIQLEGTVEQKIYQGTQKLIAIRKQLPQLADLKNLVWSSPQSNHVTVFLREDEGKRFFGAFNFSAYATQISWYAFREYTEKPERLLDLWNGVTLEVGMDHEFLHFEPYQFMLLEVH
ncbi:amylosucrase [Mongoliitalea daihaiensis]|uniref:amylosucrase n=1 Tax=Mongoliitalea daihaiensis TaxID=2782006 RepID=UPI001EE9C9A8|nr:amylosucrase [Mongoliitalea daihaiensis]UJP65428.1 alpha-amylase [Mongoliitalea daihaiensis]